MKERDIIEMKDLTKDSFIAKWRQDLESSPLPKATIGKLLHNEEFGLPHSWQVLEQALELSGLFSEDELRSCSFEAMEHIAVFHDIGKFFQEVHTVENPTIGAKIYRQYAKSKGYDSVLEDRVVDGILHHDFYNSDVDPHLKAPKYIEGKIIRAADKMLDNFITKVDRYWNYGKERGIQFFDQTITPEERLAFNFGPDCKVKTDELTYLLTLLSLKPEDFKYIPLQNAYREWSKKRKSAVIEKILALTEKEGFDKTLVRKVIDHYLETKGYSVVED